MKTKVFYLLAISAMCLLVSCGKKEKLIPELSKITGPLGEYYEVVDREYSVIDGKICIEIKRIKEGMPAPWKEGMEVGYSDGYFEPHFTIELKDDDGNTISKDNTDIVFDKGELVAISSLSVGETSSITFDAKEGALKFKIGSTFTVHGDKTSALGLNISDGYYSFEGLWESQKYNSQPCRISFEKRENSLYDSEYTNLKFNASTPLKGSIEGDSLFFEGVVRGKQLIIHLSGNEDQLKGIGNDYSHNDLNVRLALKSGETVQDIETATEEDEDVSSTFGDDEVFDDKGDESVDKFLDEYAKFMDDYIACIKKMGNNDPTALVNYGKMLARYNSLADKGEKMKGNMSSKQLQKLNNISTKILNAMQSIEE